MMRIACCSIWLAHCRLYRQCRIDEGLPESHYRFEFFR